MSPPFQFSGPILRKVAQRALGKVLLCCPLASFKVFPRGLCAGHRPPAAAACTCVAFPPSSSPKVEGAHVRSLTRPATRSIATSWPPVCSKVNICGEATVQAGSWGPYQPQPPPPNPQPHPHHIHPCFVWSELLTYWPREMGLFFSCLLWII